MALAKRGRTWHTHFFVGGQRYRQSLETSDWREAQAKEKALITAAMAGKLNGSSEDFARLIFADAAEKYLLGRLPDLAESSRQKERQLLVKSKEYFRGQRLRNIEAEDILGFRQWRTAAGVGPAIINMEVGVVRRMLKRAKRWAALAEDIKPLREPRSIGRAMSLEDKLRLLRTASSNPDWENARLAMTLALCTTMRGVEIKNLCWKDVDFLRTSLTVRRSKTEAGLRVIPMNADAHGAILELRERAKGFNGTAPDHFLFPACEHGHIDPTVPMRSWRTAWRRLTQRIQCPACRTAQDPGETCQNAECAADIKDVKSPLAGLRFHDLRHHAITELAESQASDSIIRALAGHVSPRMLERYSHIRQDAKKEAVNFLSARISLQSELTGYDTNNDTKRPAAETVMPQVVERMVGTRRLELLTSTVSICPH
jgi:integrase